MKWKAGIGVIVLLAAALASWIWRNRMETERIENEHMAAVQALDDCGFAARLQAVEVPRRGSGDSIAQGATECLLEMVERLPADQRERAATLARVYGYGEELGVWEPTANAPRDDELWDVADAETVRAQLATCDGAAFVSWREATRENVHALLGLLELRHARAALMGTEGLAERLAAIRQTADVAMLAPTSASVQLVRWIRGFVLALPLEDSEVANEWADEIDEIADRLPNITYVSDVVGLEVFLAAHDNQLADASLLAFVQCQFNVGVPGVWGRCDAECFQEQADAALFDDAEHFLKIPLIVRLAAASLRARSSSFAGIDIVSTERPGERRCWGARHPSQDDVITVCATSVAQTAAELESRRLWMAISAYRRQTGQWPAPREDTYDEGGAVVRADWDSIGFRPEAAEVAMAIRSAAGLGLNDAEALLQARYRGEGDEPTTIELSFAVRDGHSVVQPNFYVHGNTDTDGQ